MRLAKWLDDNNEKQGDFARRVGVSAPYMSQLCADPPACWPGRDVAARIREATNGAVTADDFLPPREGAEAASNIVRAAE